MPINLPNPYARRLRDELVAQQLNQQQTSQVRPEQDTEEFRPRRPSRLTTSNIWSTAGYQYYADLAEPETPEQQMSREAAERVAREVAIRDMVRRVIDTGELSLGPWDIGVSVYTNAAGRMYCYYGGELMFAVRPRRSVTCKTSHSFLEPLLRELATREGLRYYQYDELRGQDAQNLTPIHHVEWVNSPERDDTNLVLQTTFIDGAIPQSCNCECYDCLTGDCHCEDDDDEDW